MSQEIVAAIIIALAANLIHSHLAGKNAPAQPQAVKWVKEQPERQGAPL